MHRQIQKRGTVTYSDVAEETNKVVHRTLHEFKASLSLQQHDPGLPLLSPSLRLTPVIPFVPNHPERKIMEDQYGMADLRQFISDRPFFPPPVPPLPELLPSHRSLTPSQHYETLLVQRGMHHEFPSDSTNSACVTAAGFSGFEIEATGVQIAGGAAAAAGGDSCTARWPRQETLTLLEIRSRLDIKFKEANQKGPLWDEVSRIMSEEHGYQRSGKKCREKFENLYKYYKKTRDGKAGRQDGKHYRFFRQLEALYGEKSNSASVSETHFNGGSFQYNIPNKNTLSAYNQESCPGLKLSETTSLSLSNSSDSDTDLSDDTGINVGINRDSGHDYDNDTPKKKKRKGKSSWKAKIKDFIDSKMKKLMDKQEAWMEKMLRTIEHKEQERMAREEEWRNQDAARIEREHTFWASERAWMDARDATLMNALRKLAGKECRASPHEDFTGRSENQNDNSSETRTNSAKRGDVWPDSEITRLIHLRSGMEVKFRQSGSREEVLWDEISHKMACFGHDRTGLMCRNKWDSVNNNYAMNKKRKENSRICGYNHQNNESICNQTGGAYSDTSEQAIDNPVSLNGSLNSPYNNSNGGNIATSDSCFRYFMGDAYGRIMD